MSKSVDLLISLTKVGGGVKILMLIRGTEK